MELENKGSSFLKLPGINSDDFGFDTREIVSFYKHGSKPPTIQMEIKRNNSDKFLLEKVNNTHPQISVLSQETLEIYPPIEKIKNKIT